MTNAPRTKKQLREALEHAQVRLKFLGETLQEKQADLNTQAATLKALGAKPTKRTIGGFHSSQSFTTWDVSEIAASQRQLEKAVSKATEAAEAGTRRETLEKVIKALELSEYGYHKPGAYYYGFRTDGDQRPGHERLWADLTDALEVRAEKKAAEERQATEKKVAGLTKSSFVDGGFVPTYAVALSDSDRELIRTIQDTHVKIATEVPRTVTVDKPEPKKKPVSSIKLDPEKVARRAEKAAAEAKKTAKQRAEETLAAKKEAKK